MQFVLAILLFALGGSVIQGKEIRLRNERIFTPEKEEASLQRQREQPPLQGLYLLQLEDQRPNDWRELLLAVSVRVLQSVPEDAFVVKADGAQLDQVMELPFVRWMGPYKPEHKIHQGLLPPLAAPVKGTKVRVLLTPDKDGAELARVRKLLSNVSRISRTRAGTIAQGVTLPEHLAELARAKSVLWIEPAPQVKLYDELAAEIFGGELEGPGTAVQELGFDGSGVTVAVADSGLGSGNVGDMHPDLAGRVDGFFFYGQLTDASDEHSHGTHVAGIVAGNGATGEVDEFGYLYGLGVAPGAHIIGQRMFDGLGGYEPPDSFEQLTRNAVQAGADIGSNSWGDDTQGRYDLSAMEFDALVRDADAITPGDQQYILEFSAGNAGPGSKTIGSPAVAKNVIATGASQNNRLEFVIYADGEDAMADFSSRGPCEDGRIKPDLVAPGTWIASLQSSAAGDENSWSPISSYYQYQGGTSQAGPQVSGAAAVFVQYYRETHQGETPSPALVKAALINSAVDMDSDFGTASIPNNDEGWGRVELTELLSSERQYQYIDQIQPLTNSQVFERSFIISDSTVPLKITMTYTDVPGFPAAIPALVNDLDLEVIAPNGNIYSGNQFERGESVSYPIAHDTINNVEGVHLSVPEPGEYIVRVRARNVVEDARKDTLSVDQDFALVYSGNIPLPGRGVITFDRKAYRIPATIKLKLIDFDLAGQSSIDVLVRSSSETNGFLVTLQAQGSLGVFTGAVQTATLPVRNDGALNIAHGDVIEAIYQDAAPAIVVTATSRGDLLGPVITQVTSTNRFGRELVSWRTDEIANGTVLYGTNHFYSLVATNRSFTLTQEIALPGLVEGFTYQFKIVATDEAGNITTNDNAGAGFSFVARPAATVLLVDSYEITNIEEQTVDIPITTYTDALDQTGVSYEVWDTETDGIPTLPDLLPFRVVIWRVNDSFWEQNADSATLSATRQTMIEQYLDRGGAFLMASMEILSRIGEVPFRTNVLQVSEFTLPPPDIFAECDDCDQDRTVPMISGEELESVSSGMEMTLDYSSYPIFELEPIAPNIGPDLSDTFTPTTNSASILVDTVSGKTVGVRYPKTGQDSQGRVVFLSFPLDALPMDGPYPNNRPALLKNIISFLAPGVNGLGTIALDNSAYTTNSKATVEVADSDLAGQQNLSVTFRSSTDTNGIVVQLEETLRSGLFRGYAVLTSTNAPGPGKLAVQHEDSLWVEYLDASAQTTLQARAIVDTVAPAISLLQHEEDYEFAFISWTSSEPADALVQYGESPLLGRTAYRATHSEIHELVIDGLLPDKQYYYQVVNRDQAGNTSVDDNNGNFYTFKTLAPKIPPWIDDLEDSIDRWSIETVEDSETAWELGQPNNGIEETAHSGINAWGNNLNGNFSTFSQTFLISPAILLTGGNHATLRFWHAYDMTPDATFESARVLLFTNLQTQPIELASYYDLEFWNEEKIDLTPHLGRVVRVVWAYELLDFGFETLIHPGWLVDDVSVIVTNVVRGTIQVTNNLARAGFTLEGESEFIGQGQNFVRTNAIAGEYVITWDEVPYYQSPPPQTNLLGGNSTLRFTGNYTFADSNQNGLSDQWEMNFFNAVTSDRSGSDDFDGDGYSNLSEFLSGTNPSNPNSALAMVQPTIFPDGRVQLRWLSVPGFIYRVTGSSDLETWTPYSDWLRASGEEMIHTFSPNGTNSEHLFRIEVKP
ncbi:MAG: S8 family serine peptidase [Verrucomicrobiota bacterium]|nr:S8 family serine peptidase [Verrucomicrobiota bacterium]